MKAMNGVDEGHMWPGKSYEETRPAAVRMDKVRLERLQGLMDLTGRTQE
jgi:hypothetical protein